MEMKNICKYCGLVTAIVLVGMSADGVGEYVCEKCDVVKTYHITESNNGIDSTEFYVSNFASSATGPSASAHNITKSLRYVVKSN